MIIFIILFQIVLQLLIIRYLYNLENYCPCAMDYKRVYILLYLVASLLFMFFRIAKINIGRLANIYGFAGILNIYLVITYVNMLKNKQCSCSESIYRDILYITSIFDSIILVMGFLIIFYFIFCNLNIFSKLK